MLEGASFAPSRTQIKKTLRRVRLTRGIPVISLEVSREITAHCSPASYAYSGGDRILYQVESGREGKLPLEKGRRGRAPPSNSLNSTVERPISSGQSVEIYKFRAHVKDAAPIYGGVAHLSLWKPKRATNWVIPRFEPGESQILTHASHHP